MDSKIFTDVTLQVVAGAIQHTIQCFLLDRRSSNLSPETRDFYSRELPGSDYAIRADLIRR